MASQTKVTIILMTETVVCAKQKKNIFIFLGSYESDNVVQETKKTRQIMSSRSLSLELAKHKHRLAAQLVNIQNFDN